jgi:hypothetical protein
VASLAGRQFGRVTRAQLGFLGLGEATIDSWLRSGYLIRVLPRVYAVGHAAASQEVRLFEAVLYAGPDAELSHGTGAWWRGLLSWPVNATHVSTPRQLRSRPGLRIHGRRLLERDLVKGIPVTTIPQTLLDLAATEPFKLVRHALAQLEYDGNFRPDELHHACARGKPGSAALKRALSHHLPELARTKSGLEVDFLLLCERYRLPMPLVNRTLHGVEPDAWWPEFNLVVELDGDRNHRTPTQRAKDRRKEVILRSHGLTVVRYDDDLINHTPGAVNQDLLGQMRGSADRPPLTD